MDVKHCSFELPFEHPFTISKGTKTVQPTFVVELGYFGFTGYGEAPAISYYNIPVEKMVSDLESKRPFLEKFSFSDPERYWHYLHHLFPANPFLVCALDMAGWDLYGKMKKKPLRDLWDLDPARAPVTDYTIGLDTKEKMLAKMQAKPWPVYKIKMAEEEGIETIRYLRQHTDAVLRVDANAAWGVDMALRMIPQLDSMGVELVEQPLAKDDWDGMEVLYESSPLPLFADEACVSESDVDKCYGHFHGINIKLTKCSGITPARRMMTKARSLGMKIMIGCMNESSIGSAAIMHLAPLADHIDADGPLLLSKDIATGLEYVKGNVHFKSNLPGLGIEVDFDC